MSPLPAWIPLPLASLAPSAPPHTPHTRKAFEGRASLPSSAVWPASEFAGCGGVNDTTVAEYAFYLYAPDLTVMPKEGTILSPSRWCVQLPACLRNGVKALAP